MDAIEEYKIYKASKLSADKLHNEKLSFKSNRLYNAAIDIEIRTGNRGAAIILGDNDALQSIACSGAHRSRCGVKCYNNVSLDEMHTVMFGNYF